MNADINELIDRIDQLIEDQRAIDLDDEADISAQLRELEDAHDDLETLSEAQDGTTMRASAALIEAEYAMDELRDALDELESEN